MCRDVDGCLLGDVVQFVLAVLDSADEIGELDQIEELGELTEEPKTESESAE